MFKVMVDKDIMLMQINELLLTKSQEFLRQ